MRMITKALLVLPYGHLQTLTLRDFSSTVEVDPRLLFSSTDGVLSVISGVLAAYFTVNPASARAISRQIVTVALDKVCVGGHLRYGLSMSAVLEATVLIPERVLFPPPYATPQKPSPPPPNMIVSLSEIEALVDWILSGVELVLDTGGAGERDISPGGGDASGLSESEVCGMKTEKFNGEKNEEHAEVCSVCLDENTRKGTLSRR
ncbi:unnamed protein product [Cuscuta epithymum]|uniref:Uncharacterized protein n=1 Tax=Cuscuta epithymum TaxID=186058 RepID=A0AAV0D8G5_9ASTE|nr:unnamed protein product [Cuscuta epithymum]